MNTEKLTALLSQNKQLAKQLSKLSHYEVKDFLRDANDYIKAIKSGRMFCIIHSVSKSGMSRNIAFHSWQGGKSKGYYRQYYALFKTLGYTPAAGNRDAFRVNGCGMDMIFHTNYTIIHDFKRLGIITKKQCEKLAQQTPAKF